VILGSKVLIPEFEEKLVGLKKGDQKIALILNTNL
jgi:FKBP-type peptidyl-prolyl cis-trans isomerase (trigger factor)